MSLNCLELFAGAGGLVLGLEWAGLKTLLANEVHPDPCKTMHANFPGLPIICGDIRRFSGSDLLAHAGLSPGSEVNLVAGGPPCQGFSNAGLKDPDDPRNTLIGDFIRIVRDVRPDFFLLENVVGLTTLHKGRLFSRVLEQLDSIGYSFHWKIVFAADYGVPQMRKRLIVLGSKSGPPPAFPDPTHARKDIPQLDLLTAQLKDYVTCGDAIGDLPLINPGQASSEYDKDPTTEFQLLMRRNSDSLFNHQASMHRQSTMNYYALVPPGGNWLDIPSNLRKKKQGMQRWPLKGLSRTITTEPTDFIHPTLHRIPTIRELARIQTFPDWYHFLGQRTTGNKMRRLGYCAQSQQVGNAVPVLLAKAIGHSILKSK